MFLIEKLPKDTSDAVDEPLGIAMTLAFYFLVNLVTNPLLQVSFWVTLGDSRQL